MGKISLKAKIEQSKTVELFFNDILVSKTADGDQSVIVLVLADPIDMVLGSQNVPVPDGGTERMRAANVTEVSIIESDLNDNFEWDEDAKVGHYKGTDLMMDVAKRNGGVWLKAVPFNVTAGQFRSKARTEKFGAIIAGAKKGINAKEVGLGGVGANVLAPREVVDATVGAGAAATGG